jgi:UDP-N-acetylenolpyruvoylglucosamine reductase
LLVIGGGSNLLLTQISGLVLRMATAAFVCSRRWRRVVVEAEAGEPGIRSCSGPWRKGCAVWKTSA